MRQVAAKMALKTPIQRILFKLMTPQMMGKHQLSSVATGYESEPTPSNGGAWPKEKGPWDPIGPYPLHTLVRGRDSWELGLKK